MLSKIYKKITNSQIVNEITGLGVSGRDKTLDVYYRDVYLHNQEATCNALYADGIGGIVVDAIADDMTSKWINIKSDNSDEINSYLDKYNIKNITNQTLKTARMYGGSAILINIPNQPSAQPVDLNNINLDNITFVQFDRYKLDIIIDNDIKSATYGQPKFFKLGSIKIHPSKVMIYYGQSVPMQQYQYTSNWGRSVFDRIKTPLDKYNGISGLINNLCSEYGYPILKIADLHERADEDNIGQKIRDIMYSKSALQAIFLDAGDDYDIKTINFGALPELQKQALETISTHSRIPQARLLGNPPGGLNTDGDSQLVNYYDYISNLQSSQLHSELSKIINIIVSGIKDNTYTGFNFNTLWEMDPKEQAEINKLKAETYKILIDTGMQPQDAIKLASKGFE